MPKDIPIVGLGTFNLSEDSCPDIIEKALEVGYRNIDAAEYYENEELIGEGIKRAIEKGIVKREDIWITSKVWMTHLREDQIRASLKKSMDKLGVTYLDLYLIHWPVPLEEGTDHEERMIAKGVNIFDTWKIMEEFVDKGLVRHIGVSNFNAVAVAQLIAASRIPPYINQIENHPYCTDQRHIDFCLKQGVRIAAYTPIGRPGGYEGAPSVIENPVVKAIAERLGTSPSVVALAWNINRSKENLICVLPKASSEKHLRENLKCLEVRSMLTSKDMEAISDISKEVPYRYTDPVKVMGLPTFE